MPTKTKPSAQLTLRDLLSRLNIRDVYKLLGPEAAKLLPQAGKEEIDIDQQVTFTEEKFQVVFPHVQIEVTIRPDPRYRHRLEMIATPPEESSYYIAAALSLILEEKYALGLSAEPDQSIPWELTPEKEVTARALAERKKRAAAETMKIKAADTSTPWTDYSVASAASGKSYRIALRGMEPGQCYCTCPDFRKNLLGVCKHIFKVKAAVEKKFSQAQLKRTAKPDKINLHLRYDGELRLGFDIPVRMKPETLKLLGKWAKSDHFAHTDREIAQLADTLRALQKAAIDFVIYPDAEEFLNRRMHRIRMAKLVDEIRKSPATHPLRSQLLKTELLPYQLDGVAFAAGAGRAVLADEMGLGKTIQGVGVAEFLARHVGINKVLVVCPASLKSQWVSEINRFSERTSQIVSGKTSERTEQYATGAFFTICNYEQVLRDYLEIERTTWDLIILDEAQRIKNWEAQTSRIIKSLRSPFALILTGTPLENRLDDLYSVVEFIDDRQLGPAYHFIHGHRVVNETGKVLGYKNLDTIREKLRPILLRRTRQSIALDLPPRKTEIIRVICTEEQKEIHKSQMQIVNSITRKKFISEMDLLRLQKALLLARMVSNSTQLVDKVAPGFSGKLDYLNELLEKLIAEPDRKIIIFSEWTKMLNLVEPILKKLKAKFVRLDGAVPQKQRNKLVHEFQTNTDCRCFITTNAGSTGLNLQAADTVINLDLPWNPALLEQRIARAHRMGQKRSVQVYLLVTEGVIEENLLGTLSAKHELAAAVLDPDSDLSEISLTSGIEELKRRLEILLGAKPEADPDISLQRDIESGLHGQVAPAFSAEEKANISAAGGQLFASAFHFLGQVMPSAAAPAPEAINAIKQGLAQCISTNEAGESQLTLTLPNIEALDEMAKAMATMLANAAMPGK